MECKASACCFSSNTGCYHFLPSKYQLKLKSERPWSIDEEFVPTKDVSPLKTVMYESMKLDIVEESDEILSIMLWNPSLMSYNVTKSLNSFKNNSNYSWKVFSPELFIEVKRKINNETIFSTTRGALIVSENYFEWSVFLGSNDLQLMGFDTTDLKEGHRILINNVHSSVIPYVVAYGMYVLFCYICSIEVDFHAIVMDMMQSLLHLSLNILDFFLGGWEVWD